MLYKYFLMLRIKEYIYDQNLILFYVYCLRICLNSNFMYRNLL